MPATLAKVAFLDRDGTINVDRGYVHRIEDWEFTLGCVEALGMLRNSGFRIAIATHQSGIAGGRYTAEHVNKLHEVICHALALSGIHVDAVTFCPHAADAGCDCRKPRAGLARQVETVLGLPIDYAASWTIGDKPSDVEFGYSLGTRTALIRSDYWRHCQIEVRPDAIVDSLLEAARWITGNENGPAPE